MITLEIKRNIAKALLASRPSYGGNDTQFATTHGMSASIWSRVKKGDVGKVMRDSQWIRIARKLNVSLGDRKPWVVAKTEVFMYITTQMKQCQQDGISSILVDLPEIGKTISAKEYCRTNKNAFYIDCSQYKSKQLLIRAIAKSVGCDSTGTYRSVYEDLVFVINSMDRPIITLDELGDIDYSAFLELKGLWNATEYHCGWYIIGADGLQSKIERGIGRKKVGFTELFSRWGSAFCSITPLEASDRQEYLKRQILTIAQANYTGSLDAQQLFKATKLSIRRVRPIIINLSAA